MNARIASILKDRISQFTYVDRLAGMVRVGQMERAGQVLKLPIAIDADDDLACDDSTLRDMVPDERYACMVYFEDRGFQRITSRTRGTSYRSTLRLVCWVNTAKFNGDHLASERILQQFLGVVHAPSPVNTDTLVGLRTTADTGPERGGSLFSSYTYPESARPFLMWPFDAFAIDIAAEYRLRPGCEEDPVPGDTECWTPPTTKRRKNPSEFTCKELQDPVTGLTAEQLGPECLDCEGSGPCEPTTVNGVESETPTITVLQGGVQVGTLNQATGVVTVDQCPEGCTDPYTIKWDVGGTDVIILVDADPCGGEAVLSCDTLIDAVVVEGAGEGIADGIYIRNGEINGFPSYVFGELSIFCANPAPDNFWVINETSLGNLYVIDTAYDRPWEVVEWFANEGAPPVPTVRQATIADLCSQPAAPCDPLTVSVNDTEFTTLEEPCGGNVNVEVVNEDDEQVGENVDGKWVVPTAKSLCGLITEGTAEEVVDCVISSGKRTDVLADLIPTVAEADVVAQVYGPLTTDQKAELVVSVQLRDSAGNDIGTPDEYLPTTTTTKTAPDGSVSLNGTPVGAVKSNGSRNIPITLDGAAATGTWDGTTYDVDPVPSPSNIVRQYAAGDTWNKPAGLKSLFALVAGGGGGGGGAGQRNGTITGASGGGGGMVRWLRIPASELGATETITIGAGGSGGVGGTGSATAGTNGGNGGTTSFGSHISAAGGSGGLKGQSSGTIAGGAGGTIAGTRFMLPGATGGNAQGNNNGSSGSNGWGQTSAAPGGGGGGAATSGPTAWAGGNGGGVFEWDGSAWSLVAGPTGPAAGAGAGGDGSDDECLHVLQARDEAGTIGIGTGGAGGSGQAGTGSATGNAGGNGGRAAGGGGGGAVLFGTGGKGGNGGDGFCIIVEIY